MRGTRGRPRRCGGRPRVGPPRNARGGARIPLCAGTEGGRVPAAGPALCSGTLGWRACWCATARSPRSGERPFLPGSTEGWNVDRARFKGRLAESGV